MSSHGYFGTRDSGCEQFLSAPLWDEAGGALSVMSAFARLGLEPWDEAARLMGLPRPGAASTLAASLSRLPLIGTDQPDYLAIATRLVALLPERGAVGINRQAKRPSGSSAGWWLAAALLIVVVLQIQGWLL